jgi:predicted GIY-YIG superfamily endonuclease
MTTHYVYRLWDESGSLLYVGISRTLTNRLLQHNANQPWADEIDSVTGKRFASREKARAAEISAIQTEHPKYNKQDRSQTDWAADAAQTWETMDDDQRAEAVNILGRLVDNWPASWTAPKDVSARGALSSVTALMRHGMAPQDALAIAYPEQNKGGDG